MGKKWCVAVWIGLSTWGCVYISGGSLPIQYVPTNKPPRPLAAKAPEKVQVFMGTAPTTPHLEVALLTCELCSGLDEGMVLPYFRKEAGKRGCDAVVLKKTNKVEGSAAAVRTDVIYNADCLIWVAESGNAPAVESGAIAAPRATCLPGEGRACVGPGGCSGGQICNPDGTSLGPCDCGGSTTTPPSP